MPPHDGSAPKFSEVVNSNVDMWMLIDITQFRALFPSSPADCPLVQNMWDYMCVVCVSFTNKKGVRMTWVPLKDGHLMWI